MPLVTHGPTVITIYGPFTGCDTATITVGMPTTIKKGDYVLATLYSDGDAADPWCIGFYDRMEGERHLIVDGEGKQYREGGYRKVVSITREQGDYMIENQKDIEMSGCSLYQILDRF